MAPNSQYLCRLSIVLILLFAKPTIQNTHYIADNGIIVVESFQPCHLYGDPDIYGIGIRLSFYIQWATMFVALLLEAEDQVKITRWGWNVVALAVLINTLISASHGSFATFEWYIVSNMVIFLSGYFVIPFGGPTESPENEEHSGRPRPFRAGALEEDPIGIGISLLIDTVFLCSQPWLYFVILNQGRKEGCTARVFIPFASIDLYNKHWVGFLKVAAIFCVIAGVVSGLLAIYVIAYGIKRKADGKDLKGAAGRETAPEETNLWMALYRGFTENWTRLLFGVIGACFIAFVEKTLQISGVDLSNAPLTATSQLLPFLVGLFSAASLLWASVWNSWVKLESRWNQSREVWLQRGADQLHEAAVYSRGDGHEWV